MSRSTTHSASLFTSPHRKSRSRASLLIHLILLVAIPVLLSCESEPSGRNLKRPPAQAAGPRLHINTSPSPFTYGDTISLEVSTPDTTLRIASVSIDVVGGSENIVEGASPHIQIATAEIGGGQKRIRVRAEFDNGKSTSRYKELRIVAPEPPEEKQLAVVARYEHDVSDYTQGLVVHDGYVFEGTGQYGESKIKKWNLETGEVLMQKSIGSDFFGEGIAIFRDKLYQLTYKSSQAFIYDVETFEKLDTRRYATQTGEGWGLAANDTALILSDGSSYIYYYDPETFRETHRVNVFDDQGNVELVNELEYHDGLLYANLYTKPWIIVIDPVSGQVLERLSARGMVERSEASANMDVLNGIAIHPRSGNLLVTGKYWSKVYEVRAVPVQTP